MMPTLHDGREVASDSEEWRHECEARHFLSMPSLDRRRCYLYGYTEQHSGRKIRGLIDIRGKEAVAALEVTIRKIWSLRRRTIV